MSWRQLKVLIEQLPRESRMVQIVHPQLKWSPTEYLLAGIYDQLAGANWQRGGGKGPRPRPIERPADRKRNRLGKARPIREVRALFDRWKAGEIKGPTVESVIRESKKARR